jgi:uncharacterized protein (TIGR02271 family)
LALDNTAFDNNMPHDRAWEIDQGWDVFAADGEKVGDVDEVHPSYLTISKGFFFPTERYVPASAITNVSDDRVYLNVRKDEIDNLGWDSPPQDRTTRTDMADRTRTTDRQRMVDTDREMHIPVVEEQLDVEKRPVERGRVLVRKGVVTEQQSVDVPLREEEIRVERHRVDDTIADRDLPSDAFQDVEIDIPVRGEEINVTKRTVVREEVDITKDVHEKNERISDSVRREQVRVEGADGSTTTDRARMESHLRDRDTNRTTDVFDDDNANDTLRTSRNRNRR